MAGKFVISRGKDGKDYFALKAGNGEVILQSQGYTSKSACESGIDSVRRNSQIMERFGKETSTDNRFFFTLSASNGQQIGRSQMYKSESSRDQGIASVASNALGATVVTEDD